MNRTKTKVIAISLAAAVLLSGCSATMKNLQNNIGKVGGTTAGAGIGAAIGNQIGGKNGALAGAAIGGLLGYLLGSQIDERRVNLEKIAKEEKVDLRFEDIKDKDGKKIGQAIMTSDTAQFNTAKAVLNDHSFGYFIKIAKEFAKAKQKVMIVGHTDDRGSSGYNQKLSEKRAKFIANLFKENGVEASNIYYYGAGENEPIAKNTSSEGRAKNRRVEVIEAPSSDILAKYIHEKKVDQSLLTKENDTLGKNSDSKINKPMVLSKTSSSDFPAGIQNGKTPIGLKSGLSGGSKLGKISMGNGGLTTDIALPNRDGNMIYSYGDNSNEKGSCRNDYYFTDKGSIDIGGDQIPKNMKNELVDLSGNYEIPDSGFSFITKVYADNGSSFGYENTCLNDAPREGGVIKRLDNNERLIVEDMANHVPWLRGHSWYADMDGSYLSISPIAVYMKSSKPTTCPEVSLIKKGDNDPIYGTSTKVITYRGEKAFIYRLFPENKERCQCADIAFPYSSDETPKGYMYYKKEGKVYRKEFKPMLVPNQSIEI